MELAAYLQIFRQRKWIIIFATTTAIASAIIGRWLIPVEYSTHAVIRVIPYPSGEPSYTQLIYADRVMRTYIEIGSSHLVQDEIRNTLGLSKAQPNKMTVEVIPDTELLRIEVKDRDPILARDVADALADYLANEKTIREVRVTIIEPAVLPEPPTLLSRISLYLLAGLVGLLAGLGLCLLFDNLDTRVYSEEQVMRITGLAVIGKIPYQGKNFRWKLVPEHSLQKDAFNRLTTRLLVMLQESHLRTIMLTSAEPREGKTTIAGNLAFCLAQSGRKIVLIEADIYQPKVHQVFNVDSIFGLTDYLAGAQELKTIILKTQHPNLDIIPCGAFPENPSQVFFDSKRLKNLYVELHKNYDVILIDTPAFLGVADSLTIARTVDGILLAARYASVKQGPLHATVLQINAVQSNILGVILNQVKGKYPTHYRKYYHQRKPSEQQKPPNVEIGEKADTAANGNHPAIPALELLNVQQGNLGNPIPQPIQNNIKGKQENHHQPEKPGVLMLLANHSSSNDNRVRYHSEALSEAGYRVVTISPRGKDDPWKEIKNDVQIFHYPNLPSNQHKLSYLMEFAYGTMAVTALTWWVCFKFKIHLVSMSNPPDSLFIACILPKLLGKTIIYDQRDPAPELFQSKFPDNPLNHILLKILAWLERRACRIADHVITVNQPTSSRVIQRHKYSRDKVSIIRQGPDLRIVHPVTPDPDLRNRAKTILAFLGNMESQDGIDYLLHALHDLDECFKYHDWFCVLIGHVGDLPGLTDLAAQLGVKDRIWFTGYLRANAWMPLLSAADICLEPAPANPINLIATMNKLMDYMALSKPFVAFDLAEHHVTAGADALYATVNDPVSFAEKIMRLVEDPDLRQDLGNAGYRRVEHGLDWSSQREKLLKLYDNLSQSHHPVVMPN